MDPLFGFSDFAIRLVRKDIPLLANSTGNVLVSGPTGVGKELIAKKIVGRCPGKARPFVTVNCAAISPQLVESTLFGHKKGAFTGATESQVGLLKSVDGGVLFLDEFGELAKETQAKLLRVIELGEFFRIGDTKCEKVKARIIAATNNPENLREDILWRFQERITVPPLKDRPEDILAMLLAYENIIAAGQHISWQIDWRTLLQILMCEWPGNFRQFRNIILRSLEIQEMYETKIQKRVLHFQAHDRADLLVEKQIRQLLEHHQPNLDPLDFVKNEFARAVDNKRFVSKHRKFLMPRDWMPFGQNPYDLQHVIEFILDYVETFPLRPHMLCITTLEDQLVYGIRSMRESFLKMTPLPHATLTELISGNASRSENLESGIGKLGEQTIAGLARFKESELLRAYYTELRKRHDTQKDAAQAAGVSQATLNRKIGRFGLKAYGTPHSKKKTSPNSDT